ncbi:hypothetical protein POS17_3046 [Pseudomonas sp. Os17]|nr:hypothetical protein POS17_3046 [Pseudomonas sp. Os17]BAQ81030.1 hypothetical protein PST29_3141 [Pseudomonas sp. St29]
MAWLEGARRVRYRLRGLALQAPGTDDIRVVPRERVAPGSTLNQEKKVCGYPLQQPPKTG